MSATITTVPPRAEVPVEETWALETVFATDDAWEEAFASSGGGISGPHCG
jgi:oligoendopeptidase F